MLMHEKMCDGYILLAILKLKFTLACFHSGNQYTDILANREDPDEMLEKDAESLKQMCLLYMTYLR